MKHTTKLLLTMVVTLVTVIGLCGCPSPVNDYADTHEHIWELVEEVKPTCTTKGTKTYKCKLCDETKVEEVSALGHTWTIVEDAECKCIKHYTCKVCGATKTETHHHEDYETSGYCETCGKYKYDVNKFTIKVYTSKDEWANTYSPTKKSSNNSEGVYKTCHFSFENLNVLETINDLIHTKNEYLNYEVCKWYHKEGDVHNFNPDFGDTLPTIEETKNIVAVLLKPITE